jgi:omega-3 fatty acid desaturase (delta-15 desaturase)
VFYPQRKSDIKQSNDKNSNILVTPGFGLPIGWFAYLLKGYCHYRPVNHFNPFDKFFNGHFIPIFTSLCLYFSWCGCLIYYGILYGFYSLVNHHIIPVMVFAGFIVIITFLHHTEREIGWYPNSEWNYVKGQLSTVDRHYGLVHGVIHNIGTHQIHHLFTSVPHYNLEKATTSFRKHFPHLVHIKDDNIIIAFFKMFYVYAKQNVIDDIKEKDFKAYYYNK